MFLTPTEFKALLNDFSAKTAEKTYKRLPYPQWREMVQDLNSYDEITVEAYGGGAVEVWGRGDTRAALIFTGNENDGSFGTFLSKQYNNSIVINQLADCGHVYAVSANDIKNITIKENDKTMNKLFGNIEFGSCEKDNVRMSPYGLAVQNQSGTWVAYDKATESIIDVEILNFNGGKYLFKMPVALKDVAAGDVIIHGRTPVIVDIVDDDPYRLVCIDPRAGEEKIVIPAKNMFGFNFVTKVVNIFETMLGTPNAEQPFGNILPLMLLNDNGGSNSDNLALALLATQGNGNALFNNPFVFYLLNKDSNNSDSMLPLLLLSNQGGFSFGSKAAE